MTTHAARRLPSPPGVTEDGHTPEPTRPCKRRDRPARYGCTDVQVGSSFTSWVIQSRSSTPPTLTPAGAKSCPCVSPERKKYLAFAVGTKRPFASSEDPIKRAIRSLG